MTPNMKYCGTEAVKKQRVNIQEELHVDGRHQEMDLKKDAWAHLKGTVKTALETVKSTRMGICH